MTGHTRISQLRRIVLAALACLAASSVAAENATERRSAAATPLSRSCQAPMADIAAPAPLPHVAAALEERRALRIVAIGSSSTAGVGASSPAKAYPAQLEGILEGSFKGLDAVMLSRGVSGEVAATTAERLRGEVVSDRPDVVLWQVGTNDALEGVPLDAFRSTVLDTVRWLKEQRIDTVLVGLQYSPRVARDPRHRAFRQVLADIAAAENVLLVRRYDAMEFVAEKREGDLLSGDGLHQNDLGYRCMAEYVARAVVTSAFTFGKQSPRKP